MFYRQLRNEIGVILPTSFCFPHQPELTNGLIPLSIYSAVICPDKLKSKMSDLNAAA